MGQTNETKKPGRGGSRAGAGRPKSVDSTRTIALRIPQDVADILDAQPNRSAYIIAAIRVYHHAHPAHSPESDSTRK